MCPVKVKFEGDNMYDKAESSEPMCSKISGHLRINFIYGLSVAFGLYVSYIFIFFFFYHIMYPTPVLLPGRSHGRRSLVGCCLWGHTESAMTEQLHFPFSLSCIGEGNGNQWHPRDGEASWAAVYGVAQSRTRLT